MSVIEVVIGDVHARVDVLRGLLVSLGVLDSRGRRREGFWIVQVGDLLDRHASPAANLRTARLATKSLDVVVAGNHEVAMLSDQRGIHGPALARASGTNRAVRTRSDAPSARLMPTYCAVVVSRAEEMAATSV